MQNYYYFHKILDWFILHPCQHDDGYTDGRSQIKIYTGVWTQDHSALSSLTVTHPSLEDQTLWTYITTITNRKLLLLLDLMLAGQSQRFIKKFQWS